MSNVLANLSGAFDSRLNQMIGLPDVSWPNSDYQPTEGTLFLAVSMLPAFAGNINVQYTEEHIGLYQVSVFGPVNQYKAQTEAMADLIADHFLSQRVLTYNDLTVKINSAEFGSGISEDAWYQIPVSISYRAYVQR